MSTKSRANTENIFLILSILVAVIASAIFGYHTKSFVFQDVARFIVSIFVMLLGVLLLILIPLSMFYHLVKKKIENFDIACFTIILSTLLVAILGEDIAKVFLGIRSIQDFFACLAVLGGLLLLIAIYFLEFRGVSSFFKKRMLKRQKSKSKRRCAWPR